MKSTDSEAKMTPKRSWAKRLMPRFRVRTLIIVVLVAGAGMGWIADKLSRARRQREAVVAILSIHGSVDYGQDYRLTSWGGKMQMGPLPRHQWLRKWLGDDLFDTVTNVVLFRRPEVTDEKMAFLDALPEIRNFHLSLAPVTDAGLDHLAGLTRLESVTLEGLPITDAGLIALSHLPMLTMVRLDGTRIGDAGLATLGSMPRMRVLSLQWTEVTDEGLAHLVGMRELTALDLTCTEISDAGIESLGQLKSLKQLTIGGTRVTKDGRDSLQLALPSCTITWWASVGDRSTAGGRPVIPDPKP